MPEILIPLLTFVAVLCIGGAVLAVRAVKRKPIEQRLQMPQGSAAAVVAEPVAPGVTPAVTRALDALGAGMAKGKTSPKLKEELVRAGYHNPNAAGVYLGAKMLLLIVGLVALTLVMMLTSFSTPVKVVLVLLGTLVFYFLPNLIVQSQSRKRYEEIRMYMPDALDLLEICVSSGMGLDTAWNAVADEIRQVSPVLADEMALTNLEMHLGAPRAVALRHMAERTGGEDVSSLVALMVQTERFGTSIATALQTFAASMREIRSQRAQEVAEKMAVKLIMPLVLFIFPTVLIVIVGPAAITLKKALGGL